ncbi:MAG TPA: DUF3341 domain-containing protein [Polyangiaceae bacterium]|nr:DUF3341 domain-containing protein [Polyangiaceae bacterium]
MASPTTQSKLHSKARPALVLAEFDDPNALLHAAERVRDAGYKNWDVHTPYPVHGMDAAMGLSDSRLGWIVLAMGLSGLASAAALMIWANGIEYPIVVGGKPPISIASMIPICFELTILFSALGCFFGMLGLNQLPRHHHPVFFSERFKAFSTDKFFISIEAADPQFDPAQTRRLLEGLHPTYVELVEETP